MLPKFAHKIIIAMAVIFVSYAIIAGLTFKVPKLGSLGHSARNLYFHVPMWFTMYTLMAISVFYSIKYLKNFSLQDDLIASSAAWIGTLFGILGLFTGSVWSRVTWGEALPDNDFSAWWAWDPKQTLALIAVFSYFAYFILRSSFDYPEQKAKFSAIYNIFAAASLIPLTLIIPRMLGGLHPGGSEGSPVFNQKDISNDFRIVFYPAIVGFICLGIWLLNLRVRIYRLLTLKTNVIK
jgi:heme exporter protein C